MTTQPSESPIDTIMKNWAMSNKFGTARNATEDLIKKKINFVLTCQEARRLYASSKPDYNLNITDKSRVTNCETVTHHNVCGRPFLSY